MKYFIAPRIQTLRVFWHMLKVSLAALTGLRNIENMHGSSAILIGCLVIILATFSLYNTKRNIQKQPYPAPLPVIMHKETLKDVDQGCLLDKLSSLGNVSHKVQPDNHEMSFADMSTKLKIFVYELGLDKAIPDIKSSKYGVEKLFMDLLRKSSFITKDPEEATFFLIPLRCTAYRFVIPDRWKAQAFVEKKVHDIIFDIITKYPFWNHTLGADHFYICAHDLGASLTRLADPNLKKNAIALVNTADFGDEYYIPHKDIALPPHPSQRLANNGQGGSKTDPRLRTILAFISGTMQNGRIRPKLLKCWSHDADIKIVDKHLSDETYQGYLRTSKFCLCPRGSRVWSPRLIEALWFGCIPVLIADYYDLPLEGLVNWSSFSVTVPEAKISNLKTILQSISPKQLKDMQTRITKVYPHFTWNDPPQPYDAFHSVLFQLWKRKDVHRYMGDF